MKGFSFDQVELANSVDESAIITNGLSFFFDASNSKSFFKSPTVISDLSANRNNLIPIIGTIGAPGFYQENPSKSSTFSCINAATQGTAVQYYKGANTALQNASSITICFWANSTAAGNGGVNVVASLGTTSAFVLQVAIYQNGVNTGLNFKNNTINQYSTNQSTVNGWFFWSITYNSGNLSFYKNGVLINTVTGLAALTTSTITTLCIGSQFGSSTTCFLGHIGDVIIYNRALSAAELLKNYNVTKNKFSRTSPLDNSSLAQGLFAYYTMDASNTSSAADSVASNNLTFTGDTGGFSGPIDSIIKKGAQLWEVQNFLSLGYTSNFITPSGTTWSISLWSNHNNYDIGINETIIGVSNLFVMSANGSSTYGINLFDGTGNTQIITGTSNLNLSLWYHLVLVYNAGSITIYVNGVSYATATSTLTSVSSQTFNVNTGTSGSGGTDGNQIVDEIGIWNRALSQTEALKLYNNGVGRAY